MVDGRARSIPIVHGAASKGRSDVDDNQEQHGDEHQCEGEEKVQKAHNVQTVVNAIRVVERCLLAAGELPVPEGRLQEDCQESEFCIPGAIQI